VGAEGLVEDIGAAVFSAGDHEAGDDLFADQPVATVVAGGREIEGGVPLHFDEAPGEDIGVVVAIVVLEGGGEGLYPDFALEVEGMSVALHHDTLGILGVALEDAGEKGFGGEAEDKEEGEGEAAAHQGDSAHTQHDKSMSRGDKWRRQARGRGITRSPEEERNHTIARGGGGGGKRRSGVERDDDERERERVCVCKREREKESCLLHTPPWTTQTTTTNGTIPLTHRDGWRCACVRIVYACETD